MRIALLAGSIALAAASAPVIAKSSKLDAADKRAKLDQPEYYGPNAPFDPAQARALLAEGTGTIRGYLYHTINGYGTKGGLFIPKGPSKAAAGIKVYLYPVTPHLSEWQKLFTKERAAKIKPPIVKLLEKRKRPRILKFDPRMQDYQLIATADQYGRFTFPKMLPGKYYITADATVYGSYQGSEVTGHSTVYDGWGVAYGVEHTRPATHSYETPVFMEKFIELRAGEATLELDAKLK